MASGTKLACCCGVAEFSICQDPFALAVKRTPTGGVVLRQPTNGGDATVYIPPAEVRNLALALAKIAAQRVE